MIINHVNIHIMYAYKAKSKKYTKAIKNDCKI